MRPLRVSQTAESEDALFADAARALEVVAEALPEATARRLKSRGEVPDAHFRSRLDVARCEASFPSSAALLDRLGALRDAFEVVRLVNAFADAPPTGRRGITANVLVPAPTAGRPRHHVVEVALTLDPVARATQDLAATHAHVARTVRRLCRSSAPDDAKAAAVEAAVRGALERGGVDAIVDVLADKADGAFSYAALLAKHVDTKGASLGDLRKLPSGLDAMRALVSAEPEALLDA